MVLEGLTALLAIGLGALGWTVWALRRERQRARAAPAVTAAAAPAAATPATSRDAAAVSEPPVAETRPSVETVRRSAEDLARAEADLMARNRALSLLNRVISATTREFDMPRLMTIICRELAEAFDAPQVATALIDWQRRTFTVQAEYRTADCPSALGVQFPLENNPVLDYVLAHKAPLAIADVRTDERLAFTDASRRSLEARGTMSMLIVPLLVENAVVGTIGIDSTTPRVFSPAEIDLAQNIAHALSQALHNTRLIARLHASEAHLKAQFDNAPLGIALITPDGTYLDTNDRWLAMLGYTRDELAALSHFDLIHPDDCGPAGCDERIGGLLSGDYALYTTERRFIRQDGRPFWASVSASLLRDQTGDVRAVIKLIADITERKVAETEREQLIFELDAFAHTVAHDLKNPLGAVLGYTDILQGEIARLGEQGASVAHYAHAIERATVRMNGIIDSLLLLAQVRSADDILTHRLAMDRIIEAALDRLDYLVTTSAATITFTRDDWPIASGFGAWIEEVWANYLSNALKYGGSPPQIELGADDLGDGMLRFWVRDHGPGIPLEAQGALFTPFTRLHSRQKSGHGLGLSIVKRIVEKLHGTVGLESAPDEGTCFYFTLPAAGAGPDTGPDSATDAAPGIATDVATEIAVSEAASEAASEATGSHAAAPDAVAQGRA